MELASPGRRHRPLEGVTGHAVSPARGWVYRSHPLFLKYSIGTSADSTISASASG